AGSQKSASAEGAASHGRPPPNRCGSLWFNYSTCRWYYHHRDLSTGLSDGFQYRERFIADRCSRHLDDGTNDCPDFRRNRFIGWEQCRFVRRGGGFALPAWGAALDRLHRCARLRDGHRSDKRPVDRSEQGPSFHYHVRDAYVAGGDCGTYYRGQSSQRYGGSRYHFGWNDLFWYSHGGGASVRDSRAHSTLSGPYAL